MAEFSTQVHKDGALPVGCAEINILFRVECIDPGSAAGDPGPVAVRLRLWTPSSASITRFDQVAPARAALVPVDPGEGRWLDFATEPWGQERRDYVLGLHVTPSREDIRVARLQVVDETDNTVLKEAVPVVCSWTEAPRGWLKLDPELAHYLGRAELMSRVSAGLIAVDRGASEEKASAFESAAQEAKRLGDPLAEALSHPLDIEATTTVETQVTKRSNP
ncbi:MAG TPA: hypothetical protein VMI11_07505 [Actinomycetes bacterium]|nr:hypothetical protein [Actinomycetes bacterium]